MNTGALPRDKPLATALRRGQQRVLASVDEAAAKLGLVSGMSVTHAQSLVADLTVVDADIAEDARALARLGLWCIRYSPVVAIDPPDGVFIDVAGSAHLFQGEAALRNDLLRRLRAGGLAARASIADTPGCAWAVARFADDPVVPAGGCTAALASLPLPALRLPDRTIDSLKEVGIERIAHLAAKPRASLQNRFGADVLLRLDQAFGAIHEPLISLIPPEVPRVELRFAEPLATPEDLARVIALLTDMLCKDLELKGVGVRRLDLLFTRVDNVAQGARIGVSHPTRDAPHLARLLSDRLITIDPGFGIESASLTASWIEALVERQTVSALVDAQAHEADLGKLVDKLTIKLGENRIFRLAPVESDLPERAMRRVDPLRTCAGLAWPADLPRPARLLSPPEEVVAVAEVPDYPPRFFIWRQTRYPVARADGPERILGEWWRSEKDVNLTRDYYRVEANDGTRYWLFRDAPPEQGGRWWLHGVGDA